MVEIKFNKVFQFISYNQSPVTFDRCRDLFKKYKLTYNPEGKLWEGLSPYVYEEFLDLLSDIDDIKENFSRDSNKTGARNFSCKNNSRLLSDELSSSRRETSL